MQYSKLPIKMLANCIFRVICQIFDSPIIPGIRYIARAQNIENNGHLSQVIFRPILVYMTNQIQFGRMYFTVAREVIDQYHIIAHLANYAMLANGVK